MKTFTLVAGAALVGASLAIGTASPAQACVWDPAWFFLGQCNQPSVAPPAPPEQRQYHPQANPQGHPWRWWDSAGEHVCPPECLG